MARDKIEFKVGRIGLRYVVRKYVNGSHNKDLFVVTEPATAQHVAQEMNATYAAGLRDGWMDGWQEATEYVETYNPGDYPPGAVIGGEMRARFPS